MHTPFEPTADVVGAAEPTINLETLVNDSRAGDDQALDQLCAELMPLMGSVAAQHDRNPSDHEDHVQASMMKFVGTYILGNACRDEDGATVPFTGSVKGLATVITRNTVFSAHRQKIVTTTQERHEVHASEAWLEAIPAADSVEDTVIDNQMGRIDSLFTQAGCPPEMSKVVKLLYIDGYKLREVAEILGIPTGTVQSRANRGLSYVRDHFGISKGTRMWDVFERLPDTVTEPVE